MLPSLVSQANSRNAKNPSPQSLSRNSPSTSPPSVRAMVPPRNTNSDSTNSPESTSSLLRLTLRMVHSPLDTTSSPPGLMLSTRDFLDSDNQIRWLVLPKRKMLRSLISLLSQPLLTGEKTELLTPLRTKVNVDHAGLSQQLLLLKELTSCKPDNFCLSPSNNLLTAIPSLVDAKVDGKNLLCSMLRATPKS